MHIPGRRRGCYNEDIMSCCWLCLWRILWATLMAKKNDKKKLPLGKGCEAHD